jgi:hypothetical protein
MESISQRCTETLVAMEQVLSEPIKDSATTPWARFRDIVFSRKKEGSSEQSLTQHFRSLC